MRTRAAQPSRDTRLAVVESSRWPDAGTAPLERNTMSHDKLKAAARERMARTGESYSVNDAEGVVVTDSFFALVHDRRGVLKLHR
jgi:hypothetical protein